MKPIGTITRFNSFIGFESRRLIASVTEQAENYYEFVKLLVDLVCSAETSSELVYVSTILTWEIGDLDCAERIRSVHGNNIIVRVFMELGLLPTDENTWLEDFRVTLDKVVTQSPPNWVLLHLHLFHAFSITDSRPSHEVVQAFENALTLLQKSSNLDCFQALVQLVRAELYLDELDMMNALLYYTKAIDIAKAKGDQVLLQNALGRLALVVVETNPKKAIEYLEESNTVCERLGVPRLIVKVTQRLGYACYVTGEYDLALKCFYKAAELAESCKIPLYFIMMNLARIYVALEKGADALEWLQAAEESIMSRHTVLGGSSFLDTLRAEAMILLGRMEEADLLLNRAHKGALESGFETGIGFSQYARGVYLLNQGDSEAALDILEDALKAFQGFEWGNGVTTILLALTRAEIMSTCNSLEQPRGSVSGPWMAKLETRARKRNLTGILMQVALLKAEFLVQCNRVKDARLVLENALGISESLSVKTLRERILDRLTELIES